MPRWPLVPLALVSFAACGEPNATLTVQLDATPQYTNATTLTLTGTVSRAPAEETITVVVVAGGVNTVRDSLASPGAFSIQVQLQGNTENQLAVTASDASGNVSAPVVVVVYHDNMGPTIAQMTPPSLGDNAALDTPIDVVFSERLTAQAGSQIRLLRNSEPVIGTPSVSTDSLRVSFAAASPLEPNSVYQLELQGFTDHTGNAVSPDVCFVTTTTGTVSQTDQDGVDEGWVLNQPPSSLVTPNLQQIRWARVDSLLYGVVRFATPRVFAPGGNTSAIVIIEIDADQDETTGFESLKDAIFSNFPELKSGISVEYWIGLEPHSELGDSAYVGILTASDPNYEFTVIDTFRPGVCGPYYGFNTSALLGNDGDDGRFDYTAMAFTFTEDGNSGIVDPMPESGHLSVDITGIGARIMTSYAILRPPHPPRRATLDRRMLSGNRVHKER